MRVRFFSLLAGLSLCGCAAMQDYHYNWVQIHRADAAWRESYGLMNSQFSKDYKEGWKAGYSDIARGNCHEPPPVPPKKYWAAAYQSPDGRCCIDEWYNGWRDGAAASSACGNEDWHAIPPAPTVPAGMNSTTGYSTAAATPAAVPNVAPPTEIPAAIPVAAKPEKVKAAAYDQPPVHVAPLPEYGDDTIQARVSIGAEPVGSALSDNYAVPLDPPASEPAKFSLGDDDSGK